MNILTHLLLSKKVYSDINSKFSIDLSLGNFLWGSIKPDLTNTDISHCKDETFYFFYQKLKDIKSIDFNNDRDKYSLELGEISHYLCDYFCYAHNDKDLLRYFPHICYENNLHKIAKKIEGVINFSGYNDYSHLSFLDLIELKHKQYLSNMQSYENDITSAYKIIMLVIIKLAKEAKLITYSVEEISRLSVNIS